MSEIHIASWLDEELDESEMRPFESWLREKPDHLQLHFESVQLQEELRALHRTSPRKLYLPTVQPRTLWGAMLLSAAAIILLAAFLSYPNSSPRPTADPRLFVLAGHPLVEMTQTNSDPLPAPVPVEGLLRETLVETQEQPSSIRWNDDYVLEMQSNTSLTLRCSPERIFENDPPSLQLDRGGFTLKLAVVSAPIDILVGGSRIRVARPTVFTLSDLRPMSEGPSVKLRVEKGSVEASIADDVARQVNVAETILLP